jgi:hypothetical protein
MKKATKKGIIAGKRIAKNLLRKEYKKRLN